MLRTRTKRLCRFCENSVIYVDYRDEKLLTKFMTDQGKIIPRRISGTCAKHQRQLSNAIKIGRQLALIPYVIQSPR